MRGKVGGGKREVDGERGLEKRGEEGGEEGGR